MTLPARQPARFSQCARILHLLKDGKPHTTAEIHQVCGPSRLNSRIAELRKRGWDIEGFHVAGKTGASGYGYQLVSFHGEIGAFQCDVDESGGVAELFDDDYSRKVPA
jgi:hypothetical protein